MSNHAILDKIEELFTNPTQFTPENMENLIHETVKFFNDLKMKLESPDEKVREEALNIASTLKTKLEEQALSLCDSIGMDPQLLESYINTSANFSPEEWLAMEKAKTEINNYNESVKNLDSGETLAATKKRTQKKKPKAVKEWIVG